MNSRHPDPRCVRNVGPEVRLLTPYPLDPGNPMNPGNPLSPGDPNLGLLGIGGIRGLRDSEESAEFGHPRNPWHGVNRGNQGIK